MDKRNQIYQLGNTSILLIILVILVLLIGGFFYFKPGDKKNSETPPMTETEKAESPMMAQFATPKKSAHYETNTPAHGSTLAAPPVNVVIDFNFDLAPPSAISIKKDGNEYATGETVIDTNKLAMRRTMNGDAPDGIYTVEYNACWPDKSCHDGNFQFAIDRTLATQYEDMRNSKAITIRMSEIAFIPKLIRISQGTKITWMNDDSVEHYVNADSHPAHTFVKDLNSQALQKGETYSYTFTQTGDYPYHCSAHADTMTGSILVE